MSETGQQAKSYEVLEEIILGPLTLPAGHYMGIATWRGSWEAGKVTQTAPLHFIELKRDQFVEFGGQPPNNDPICFLDVTAQVNAGEIR